jgi:hypothetical protein
MDRKDWLHNGNSMDRKDWLHNALTLNSMVTVVFEKLRSVGHHWRGRCDEEAVQMHAEE